MDRTILFKSMPDDKLKQCYHQYIGMELKKEIDNEPLLFVLENYKKDIGDKAAYAIMSHDMLIEIARRWVSSAW